MFTRCPSRAEALALHRGRRDPRHRRPAAAQRGCTPSRRWPTPDSTSRRSSRTRRQARSRSGESACCRAAGSRAIGATLRELIRAAYGLREDAQISGGPNWVSTDRFDIEAKAPADASPAQVQAMLKALLADRFKLTAHTESRQLPLYALVMAKSDGKMGARLRRSGTECAPITIPAELGPAPPPPPPPPAGAPRLLVARTPMRCGSMLIAGMVSAREITMEQFIVRLSAFVGRPVIDRTGLTGDFDLDLSYTPESPTRGAIGVPVRRSVHLHRAAGTAWAEARLATRPGRRLRHRSRGAADTRLTPAAASISRMLGAVAVDRRP